MIRSFASGFIFSSSLPPALAAGALAAIRHLKTSSIERERQQDRVATLRRRLDAIGIPHLPNPSHIVPVMVGDPVLCKRIADELLARFDIYVQPINYPTVPRGTERLRITPSPLHSDADIEHLVDGADGDLGAGGAEARGLSRPLPLEPQLRHSGQAAEAAPIRNPSKDAGALRWIPGLRCACPE